MRRRRTLGWIAAGVGLLVVVLVVTLAMPYLRTMAFLADMAGTTPAWRSWLPVPTYAVTTRDLEVPTRIAAVQARLYQPTRAARIPVVVFPGIHAGGLDEPRLDQFSRRLAMTGFTVLSVPLPDLRAFRITRRSTDMLEDVAVFAAHDTEIAPTGKIALVGVSFSGGLALVAAGRPSLANHVTAVVSLGGHADLPRTMRYLCTGQLPDGTVRPPLDYGAAVILVAAIPDLVPEYEVDPLRQTVAAYLVASSVASTDTKTAETLYAQVRARSTRLAEPARTIMGEVNDRDVAALGPRLLPLIDALGSDPALSPDRSPAAKVPVFLLHGLDDNVIPTAETPLLADYLRAQGNTHVRVLLTPLLTHAALQPRVGLIDGWRLVRFWHEVFETAGVAHVD